MKMLKTSLFAIAVTLFVSACSKHQMSIQVPAKEKVVLDYPNYDVYMATLQNRSVNSIEISVTAKNSQDQIKGFGLGPMATEKISVEQENQLVLTNTGKQDVNLRISINEAKRKVKSTTNTYRTFTLRNKSAKSLPLIIPNVMNPNLSPFSNSGVDLKIGQEILFRSGMKKYVLLTVDENIKNGDTLLVNDLLTARKKELGL